MQATQTAVETKQEDYSEDRAYFLELSKRLSKARNESRNYSLKVHCYPNVYKLEVKNTITLINGNPAAGITIIPKNEVERVGLAYSMLEDRFATDELYRSMSCMKSVSERTPITLEDIANSQNPKIRRLAEKSRMVDEHNIFYAKLRLEVNEWSGY